MDQSPVPVTNNQDSEWPLQEAPVGPLEVPAEPEGLKGCKRRALWAALRGAPEPYETYWEGHGKDPETRLDDSAPACSKCSSRERLQELFLETSRAGQYSAAVDQLRSIPHGEVLGYPSDVRAAIDLLIRWPTRHLGYGARQDVAAPYEGEGE